jgi:hypothetical protein
METANRCICGCGYKAHLWDANYGTKEATQWVAIACTNCITMESPDTSPTLRCEQFSPAEPNYQEALKACLNDESAWNPDFVDFEEEATHEANNGNHFFQYGYTEHSAWDIEAEAAWLAELKPVFDADGAITSYEVVEIEQVL